uniref:Uncharacterized protein n=1 Tax=Arundo donax TaxID=35708 RepID=A0A0A8XUT5_ARUDO
MWSATEKTFSSCRGCFIAVIWFLVLPQDTSMLFLIPCTLVPHSKYQIQIRELLVAGRPAEQRRSGDG